ncbi:hypothetical protein [Facklamia sp. 7083-14-GEN3]|uniref:hypothetical protein n=1 Tax=Facklamia sp. 7083-14-GEN3 TaxID=2973478 RepID=UPI00215C8F47|nr:hypothetical protein [Facklamia sp. 7083-14-GEN3]MCR8969657.1 hypothetical protein [Facklamia sp. 7083-14-GEN3]
MGKTLKAIISIALVLGLVGVVALYAYVDSNSKANHVQKTNQEFTNISDDIQSQIDELYYDEKKDFLIETFQEEMIDPIKENINRLNESTSVKNQYLDQLDEIKKRFEAQNEVNDFFTGTKEAIRGNKVNDNLIIREGLTKDKVLEVKEKYYYEEIEKDEQNQDQNEEVELDAFQKAINLLIDQVEESVIEGNDLLELFKNVEKIDIVDGNIGKIAQAMRKFDQRLIEVKDSLPSLYKSMDKKADTYTNKVIKKVAEIAKNVPQYYQLLVSSLEPSERLSQALEDNKELFEGSEETTVEIVETSQSVSEPVETSNDYYFENPDNSWTNPEPTTPSTTVRPGTSEPVESTQVIETSEVNDEDYYDYDF